MLLKFQRSNSCSPSGIVIAVLHAVYLALFVTKAGVFEAERTYARQLWLCTHSPDLGNAPKPQSVAARKPRKPKVAATEDVSQSDATYKGTQ